MTQTTPAYWIDYDGGHSFRKGAFKGNYCVSPAKAQEAPPTAWNYAQSDSTGVIKINGTVFYVGDKSTLSQGSMPHGAARYAPFGSSNKLPYYLIGLCDILSRLGVPGGDLVVYASFPPADEAYVDDLKRSLIVNSPFRLSTPAWGEERTYSVIKVITRPEPELMVRYFQLRNDGSGRERDGVFDSPIYFCDLGGFTNNITGLYPDGGSGIINVVTDDDTRDAGGERLMADAIASLRQKVPELRSVNGKIDIGNVANAIRDGKLRYGTKLIPVERIIHDPIQARISMIVDRFNRLGGPTTFASFVLGGGTGYILEPHIKKALPEVKVMLLTHFDAIDEGTKTVGVSKRTDLSPEMRQRLATVLAMEKTTKAMKAKFNAQKQTS